MHLLALTYPAIDPVALRLGPLEIKWYGLAYVMGLLLGWIYMKRLVARPHLWRHDQPPMTPAQIDDLFLWVALGVVVGGRLGHVLLYEGGYYLSRPMEILKVWRGGMAFHGGMIGTIVAVILFCRRRGISALSALDLVSAAVPLGLLFGRIANFINAEVVGRVSDVPWAMAFPGYGPETRHPSQLYEAFFEGLVVFLLLAWLIHRRGALRTPGLIGAVFLVGYGAGRMFCELFKIEEYGGPFVALGTTNGMIYSLPMVLIGIWGIWWTRQRAVA